MTPIEYQRKKERERKREKEREKEKDKELNKIVRALKLFFVPIFLHENVTENTVIALIVVS